MEYCTEVRLKTTDHTFDNGVITTQPTEDSYGVKTFTCSCGETMTESVDKLPPTTQPNPDEGAEDEPNGGNSSSGDAKGCATVAPFSSGGGFGGGLAIMSLVFIIAGFALKTGKRKTN